MNNLRIILNKKYKIITYLIILLPIFCISLFTTISQKSILTYRNYDFDGKSVNNLKISGQYESIEIDDIVSGKDWVWAETQPWCTGNGTISEPYMIEGHTFEDASGQKFVFRIFHSRKYFTIRNCTFMGATGKNTAGIYVENVTNGNIESSEFYSNDIYGIHLQESHFIIISNNNISNNDECGIYLSSSHNNTISDNNIYNNVKDDGIFLEGSADNEISGNNIKDNADKGIDIASGSDNNRFFNNTFINNIGGNAIDLGSNNAWNNTNIGNYWDDYQSFDMDQDGIGDDPYDVPPVGGSKDYLPIWDKLGIIMIDDSLTGLGAHNWTWASNQIWCNGSGSWGDPYVIENLSIDGQSLNSCITVKNSNVVFIIQDCVVYDSSSSINDAGILLINVNNSLLINNNASNNKASGICLIDSYNNSISENKIINNWIYGICVNKSLDNKISDNIISSNTDDGIFSIKSNKTLVSGNTVGNNGDDGIYLEFSTNNTLTDNKIEDNINIGVNVVAESNNNLFFYNFFINKNTEHATDDSSNNNWNNTIIGNFWDDYPGSDLNFDGIGDDPYDVPPVGGSKDYLPIWDDSPPNIIINYPNTGDIFSANAPTFNVIIVDFYLDTMWYTIDGGATNYTFTTNGTINQAAWNNSPDGNITLSCYANDKEGKTNFEEVIVTKDTIAPSISVTAPVENENYNTTAPAFIVEIKDLHLDTMWYTIDGGVNFYMFTDNGTINQAAWDSLPDKVVTITFHANDTARNINSTQVDIKKETSAPSITIISPNFNDTFGTAAPPFIVEIEDPNLDTMWYIIDGSATKYAFTTNGTINQAAWTSLSEGIVTIAFYANDTLSQINFEEVDVIKDTIVPNITVITPVENKTFGNTAPSFVVEIRDLSLDVMWYTINNSATKFVFTQNSTIDQTAWNNLTDGFVILTFYANDTAGNLAFKEIIIKKNTPSRPDSAITTIVIVSSILGGIAVGGVIFGILIKKGKISLDKLKIKKPSFRKKSPTEKTPEGS